MRARACAIFAMVASACGRIGFDLHGDSDGGADSLSYAAAVLADQPRAYYQLDDADGMTMVRDSSGNSYDASVYTITPGTVMTGVAGALPGSRAFAFRADGNAFTGDGSEAVAYFPDVWPTWSGDFTIEAWVNPESPGQDPGYNMSIVLCEHYLNSGFRTGWNSRYELETWSSESGGTAFHMSTRALAVQAWTHLAIVHSGGQLEVFFDGASDGGFAFPYVPPTPLTGVNCGFGAFDGLPSRMFLDELAIYDVALTPAQIAAHLAAAGR